MGNQVLGPTILCSLIASGRDVETYVRATFENWKAQNKAYSAQAASEAVGLARSIRLCVLESGCPRLALRRVLALEVMLRRLFALIMVERHVNSEVIARAQASRVVRSILYHARRHRSERTRSRSRCAGSSTISQNSWRMRRPKCRRRKASSLCYDQEPSPWKSL